MLKAAFSKTLQFSHNEGSKYYNDISLLPLDKFNTFAVVFVIPRHLVSNGLVNDETYYYLMLLGIFNQSFKIWNQK